jgi:flavin-dependent dehydrogenase
MMKNVDVIIVGGGPAGAACAWKLAQHQVDFLVLDKAIFPRVKPCAGWITPLVLRDLEINPTDYPFGIKHFTNFQVSIKDFQFKLRTNQYAIRRVEFDGICAIRIHCIDEYGEKIVPVFTNNSKLKTERK